MRIDEISKCSTATRRLLGGAVPTPCAIAHGYKRDKRYALRHGRSLLQLPKWRPSFPRSA